MSRCPKETEWVLYAAEELPAARQDELRAHLAGCEVCRRQAETLTRGLSALSALPRETALRPEAVDVLRQRLRVAAADKQARPTVLAVLLRWRWAAAAAVILAVALVWPAPRNTVVVVQQPQPTPKRSPVQPPEVVPVPVLAKTAPRFTPDAAIREELAEITARIELLQAADTGRMPEVSPTLAPPSDEDPVDELEQLLEYWESELDT
jgi:hypothetical protein